MSSEFKDLDPVEVKLSGTIVGDSGAPYAYLVELFDPDGMTIDVVSLPAEVLRRRQRPGGVSSYSAIELLPEGRRTQGSGSASPRRDVGARSDAKEPLDSADSERPEANH